MSTCTLFSNVCNSSHYGAFCMEDHDFVETNPANNEMTVNHLRSFFTTMQGCVAFTWSQRAPESSAESGRIRSVSNAPGSVWFSCCLHRLKARQCKAIKSTHEIRPGWSGRTLRSTSGLHPLRVISVLSFASSRSREPLRWSGSVAKRA